MREKKNVRIKMMGAKYSGFLSKKFPVLGSVMFLSCLAFPLPTFAERMSQDETILEKEISSEEGGTISGENIADGGNEVGRRKSICRGKHFFTEEGSIWK